MDATEVKALDKLIETLRKLDYRVSGKKLNRTVFITNAIKNEASQALLVIKKEVKKIEEVQA